MRHIPSNSIPAFVFPGIFFEGLKRGWFAWIGVPDENIWDQEGDFISVALSNLLRSFAILLDTPIFRLASSKHAPIKS